MKNCFFNILVFFTCLVSCTSKKIDTQTINVNLNNTDKFIELSDYFDGEIVCLEKNDECLIGQIDKVKVTDSNIFVLDKNVAKAIFMFDHNGKFIRKFDKYGKGEGEYLYLEDFDIYDDILYIMSSLDQKILQYDYHNDGFIKETKLSDHGGYEIKVLPDQNYFTVRANSILRIDFWNSKGKQTSSILDKRFPYLKWSASKAISSNINGNYICPAIGNMIYKVKNSNITPVYKFNFLNNNFSFDEIDNKDEFEKAIESKKKCWVNSFSLSNNFLIFSYLSNNVGFGLYNINSNKVTTANVLLYKGILLSSIVGETEDGFILSQDAPIISQLMSFFREHDLHLKYPYDIQDISIDDNPVLFLLKTKNDTQHK